VNKDLTSLNIDALTSLKYLNIAIAPLDETLNITKNIELEELIVRDSVSSSPFENFKNTGEIKLYVAGLPALKQLQNVSETLVELHIDNCEKLESVSDKLNRNMNTDQPPGKLKIENCPALRNVFYRYANLGDADIRNCAGLDSLDIFHNKVVSFRCDSKGLTDLNCSSNSLTSLDISGCTGLKELNCENNTISSLTMNDCLDIEAIYCSGNQIPALRVDHLSKLQNLYCSGNLLTSLDISKNPAMDRLSCTNNPDLTKLYMSKTQVFSVFDKDGQTEIVYTD
jgi:Leucine-rich repeat (LRR) protein